MARQQKQLLIFGSLVLLFTAIGCNQYAGQWSSSKEPFAPLSLQEASVKLNYAYVKSNILDNYCTSCHGDKGGVNLESPEAIRQHSSDILRVIADRSMPQGDSATKMSDSDRAVLYNWVKSGAPIGTAIAIPLYPPLSAEDQKLKLNYTYIQSNILVPRCISCHGNAGKLSFEDIDSIRKNAGRMISDVAANKSMPKGPRAKGMTEDDRAVLYNWLIAGAPQGDAPVPSPYNSYPPLSESDFKTKMNYTYVRDNILVPKCIACHGGSGRVNLETLPNVQKNARQIMFEVFSTSPSMPPFGKLRPGWDPVHQPIPDVVPASKTLSDNDMQVLFYWLKAGAPQGGDIVTPADIQPTFDDINKRIFQVRCMDCHDQTLPDDDPPTALTKEALLDPSNNYVKPGNPDDSPLMKVVNQTVDDDPDLYPMPPPKKGYAKLPQNELDVIRKWIQNGAKD